MKIISTFNDKLYEFSGKKMIESARALMPDAEIQIYTELEKEENLKELHEMGVKTIDIKLIPQRQIVFEKHKDIISKQYGGDASLEDKKTHTMWNIRWFGWFHKVLACHHAVAQEDYDGWIVFADSDIRFTKGFDVSFIESMTKSKAIGFFKGNRGAVETGLICIDCRKDFSKIFYDFFMDIFISGEFRQLNRWDDSKTFTVALDSIPAFLSPKENLCDMAEGVHPSPMWTNSNGHVTSGQIISQTEWANYVEHDKGLHARKWGKAIK